MLVYYVIEMCISCAKLIEIWIGWKCAIRFEFPERKSFPSIKLYYIYHYILDTDANNRI